MLLKDFLPNPALRSFVQCYRIVHFEFDKTASIPYKIYPPKPENILHFFLRDSFAIEQVAGKKENQPPVTFIGQRTLVTKQHNGSDFLNFQIVFQPAAIFRLTGIPAFQLSNQFIDAECIFSRNIGFVYEQLQYARTYEEMLLIADKFVSKLIDNTKRDLHLLDKVSSQMIQSGGNISLDWLAKESCLCPKQFKRKFHERTGVNPKPYAKIIRLTKAFNTKNRYPNMDWLRIAVECGYFDYQHLVKDYKQFTGFTPTEFHLLENNSPESRLGLADNLYRSRI